MSNDFGRFLNKEVILLPYLAMGVGFYFGRKSEKILHELKPLMSEVEIIRYFDPEDW